MEFKENDGCGIWLVNPLSYARIDARLYKFIVEMQFGIMLSLHRDFMGSSFFCAGISGYVFPSSDASNMRPSSGRPSCSGNQRIGCCSIRAGSTVRQGLAMKSLTRTVVSLCDAQIEEFQFRRGLVGEVRQILMKNLMRPKRFRT